MRSGRRPADEGWTLLEVMVVVLIMSILVTIAVGSYTLTNERAKRVACQYNLRTVNDAVQVYRGAHQEQAPAALADIAPYVHGRGWDHCAGDAGLALSYDATTGVVTCPTHSGY